MLALDARFSRDAASGRLSEVRDHVVGPSAPHGCERAPNVLRLAIGSEILHLIGPNAPVQLNELAHHRVFERHVGGGWEALHSIAAAQHGRLRESHENRPGEVWMPQHGLTN